MRALNRLLRLVLALMLSASAVVFAGPLLWCLTTGDTFMTVTGTSMEPTYQVGTVVAVRQPDGSELSRVGEPVVVTLVSGEANTQYVHRVQEITKQGAILKGDNNAIADPGFVTQDRVVGSPRFELSGSLASLFHLTQNWTFRGIIAATIVCTVVWSSLRARKTS